MTNNTKTAHTPGPWMLCESADARNRGYIRPDPLSPAICKITETGRAREWRANARLIAAAPEMFEALKADASHVHSVFECGEDRAACPVVAFKRAAIAKAEGK
jgi:hypothetical protein